MTDEPKAANENSTQNSTKNPEEQTNTQPEKIQKIKAQLKKQLQIVKISAQNTYQQALNKATQTVDRVDTWAVDRVNENIDKVTETVDRSRLEAQEKLQKSLKQTQTNIQEKAKNTSDLLKNVAQSAWKKIKD